MVSAILNIDNHFPYRYSNNIDLQILISAISFVIKACLRYRDFTVDNVSNNECFHKMLKKWASKQSHNLSHNKN